MKKLLLFIFFFLPVVSLAQGFESMVTIPGLSGDPSADGFSDYINALYRLSISIAALIAVVKIIGAGVKYMFSDIVTNKSDAIKDIRSSLLGLLVVIGAVLILSTVNEDLTNFAITLTPITVEAPPDINYDDTVNCGGLEGVDSSCEQQDCYGFLNSNPEINAFAGLTDDQKKACFLVAGDSTPTRQDPVACARVCADSCNILRDSSYSEYVCRYSNESMSEYAAAQLLLLANSSTACPVGDTCTAQFCDDASDQSLALRPSSSPMRPVE